MCCLHILSHVIFFKNIYFVICFCFLFHFILFLFYFILFYFIFLLDYSYLDFLFSISQLDKCLD